MNAKEQFKNIMDAIHATTGVLAVKLSGQIMIKKNKIYFYEFFCLDNNKYITEKHAFRIFCTTNLLLNGARHYLGITIEYRPRNYLQTYSQTCANVNYHLHVYTEMLAYVLEN